MAIFWLVTGVALAIAEMFTMTFVLVMFAAGALSAAAVAALGAGLVWQILAFTVVSGLALGAARPVVTRFMGREGDQTPIGMQAIEGEVALVLEEIDSEHGLVKIGGEMWRARPYDASQVIEAGERVRVIEVKGATAMVWRDFDGTG